MKSRILSYHSLNTDVASLLLRLIFGGLFVRYGYLKILSFNDYYSNFPDLIGIGGKLSFILVIFAEFFCGLLVTLGFLTRLSVIPIFITMFVAYFIAHAKDPFDTKAIAFVFLLLSVVVFVLGSGKYSVDRLLFKK
jgi:putative oxidoreductase